MKKTTLAVALALAGFTSIASAAPESNAFYVGGKLGWSKYFNTHSDRINLVEGDVDSVKTNDFGAGVFLGYQANPYLAIELGYDYLGQMKYKFAEGDDLKVRVMGGQLTGKLSYPLDFVLTGLDIYARGGLMVTNAKVKGVDGLSESKTDVAPVYALGFDYKLADNLTTRLEYQWVQTLNANVSHDGTNYQIRPDNALLSVGLTYSFGSLQPAAVEPAPVEVVQQTQVSEFSEDVLFGFGKDSLRPEGKEALNALLGSLAAVNPTSGSIVVIGHADRIGSAAYNLKLSQQRADEVRDYLVSKGVPANVITARGVGSTEPVSGDKCNGISNRQALITCLAPDRRVVIEVTAEATQDVEVPVQQVTVE